MSEKFRWGFVGTGRIAERIMPSFRMLPQAEVVAAYSRNREAMDAFCKKWSIPKQYAELDDLLADPEIDIIYLATPHIVHFEHTRKALLAGKHVLCEKPMAMDAQETRVLVELAREKKVFFMEALWTKFFPLHVWLRELLGSGRMGTVYNVMVDFSYHDPYDYSKRFFRRDLGGGAMRGAGIYPLVMATMVFGAMPSEILSMADMRSEVDLRSAALLRFPCGGTAEIYTGFQGDSIQAANISCEKGHIWIPDFWHPDKAIVYTREGTETITRPYEFPGFQFELIEVMRCVSEGKLESDIMPLDESIGLSVATDEMYRVWRSEEARS